MFFARIVLAIQALVMGGFGLAYWLWPYEMANLNGMLLMETVSVSNMRVYYGGLQLGLAIFLLWSMRRPERASPALVLLVLIQLSLSLARLGALWLDGGALQSFDLTSLVYKLAAAGLALLALYLLARQRRAEAEREAADTLDGSAFDSDFDEPPAPQFNVRELPLERVTRPDLAETSEVEVRPGLTDNWSEPRS
ncbi:DUF4345 domain-containing protein [Pseudomonas indica]|uniref:DUF4345 domain-containing protein n=1 Tax=Pseudomonas indica TaxID=137658 RepID=UPI003FD0E875